MAVLKLTAPAPLIPVLTCLAGVSNNIFYRCYPSDAEFGITPAPKPTPPAASKKANKPALSKHNNDREESLKPLGPTRVVVYLGHLASDSVLMRLSIEASLQGGLSVGVAPVEVKGEKISQSPFDHRVAGVPFRKLCSFLKQYSQTTPLLTADDVLRQLIAP